MRESEEKLIGAGLRQHGWILLTPPVLSCAKNLAMALGPIILSQRTGLPFVDLVPYSAADAPPGSMSSLVGKGAQPMHSDGAYAPTPPRYLIFECLDAGGGHCPTQIWVLNLEAIIAARHALLTVPQWVYGSRNRGFYSSIVQRTVSDARARFDPLCMAPAAFNHSSILEAQSILKLHAQEFSIDWQTGAILIMDNWRCLHARGVGSKGSPARKLRRWQVGDGDGMGQQSSV